MNYFEFRCDAVFLRRQGHYPFSRYMMLDSKHFLDWMIAQKDVKYLKFVFFILKEASESYREEVVRVSTNTISALLGISTEEIGILLEKMKKQGLISNANANQGFLENPGIPGKIPTSKDKISTEQGREGTSCTSPSLDLYEDENHKLVEVIIDYLNEKANKKFKYASKQCEHIAARIRQGHTLDEFKRVIDIKVAQWKNDTKMNSYLRPETLFNASKFEAYLNESDGPVYKTFEQAKEDYFKKYAPADYWEQ